LKFDDLDRKMRVFETASDSCVLPGLHMVARLDGRSFTRLTRETCKFEAPFDERFRDLMVETVAPVDPGGALRGTLRPYQQAGVRWLHLLSSLGLGAVMERLCRQKTGLFPATRS
jgi:SNF2 family DNA or RNA helicase